MDRVRLAAALEELARDLDLAVFELEQPPRPDAGSPEAERQRLRRRLERARERLVDLAERTLAD